MLPDIGSRLISSFNKRIYLFVLMKCKDIYKFKTDFLRSIFIKARRPLFVQSAIVVPLCSASIFRKEEDMRSRRLKLFQRFATIQYRGSDYMTPQNFLDSLTLEEPRGSSCKVMLEDSVQLESLLRSTPPLDQNSSSTFRELGQNGIISYAEYLFLLTLLTKSHLAFQTAFLLFDEDENMQIGREEFLKLERLISCKTNLANGIAKLDSESSSFTKTTLQVHLFGADGRDFLPFEKFKIFCHNLQKELIQIEFNEFAKGKEEISAVDFAHLILRYSFLQTDDRSVYIERVQERSKSDTQGITFQHFEQFQLFLNNLEEFAKAVKLYTVGHISVSQSEFIRAVKCSTGFVLDPHLVEVVFRIFDVNGDKRLSYSEFIEVMTDRLHRGCRNQGGTKGSFGWQYFKKCLQKEFSTISSKKY